MTYQQIIDMAVQVYTRGADPNTVDSDVALTAQALASITLQDITVRYSGDERARQILKQTFSLTVVNGTVTLDGSVLTSTLADSLLYDPSTPTDVYNFQRNYSALFGSRDFRLGDYAVREGADMFIVKPGAVFDPTSGATQTFSLTVACVPTIPVTADLHVTWPSEFQSDFIAALAEQLKGVALPA